VDAAWLRATVGAARRLFTVDDHYVEAGQGDRILSALAEAGWPPGLRARKFGVTGLPACGQNPELLKHHRLDAESLAEEMGRLL
jgi:transketolase